MVTKTLADPVSLLKGVGPKKVQILNKLGIDNIQDLLTYYPFRYDDLIVKQLNEIADQEKVVLKGMIITEPVLARFGHYKSRLTFRMLIEHDVIMVTFFNQPYLKEQLINGNEIAIYGKYDIKRQSLTAIKILGQQHSDDFAGVYRANKEIKANTIKSLVTNAYEQYQDVIEDVIPADLQLKYRLEKRQKMIHDMHFPASKKDADKARRSAIFEEFFCFQAAIQQLKKNDRTQAGQTIKYDLKKVKEFIKALPFELTNAQKRVVNEICADLLRPHQMNRLLQGDVGSGKTIIAAIAMYAAVSANKQAALMAPTEILAQQHAQKLQELLAPFDVNVSLLIGSTKTAHRKELLKQLELGNVDIVIGTHALIQKDVIFKDLALVITDEQHRFGVNQRKILRTKGSVPDVLAMTATPIPRTLALTTYGEMDVSIIDELPNGRQPIMINWLKKQQLNAALNLIKEQLQAKHQAYVVSPLIEESEQMDLQNAQEVYQKLCEYFSPDFKVGLLHGKMKGADKDAVMQAFKDKEYDVLVSTTVIEVGVDVANATVMLILDADRFGLAQLHQLRGRVGRGANQSYCILLADPKNDYGKQRMQTMVQTNDGFVIAQKDLELRGPGDVLGSKQSGLPEFRVGDPIADLKILQIAQQEAHELINAPDFLTNPKNAGLIRYLREFDGLQAGFD